MSAGTGSRTSGRSHGIGVVQNLLGCLLLGLVAACGDGSSGNADSGQSLTPDTGQSTNQDTSRNPPDSADIPDTGVDSSVADSPVKSCVRNGVLRMPGDPIPDADGCGTCVCLSDGTIGNCTRIPGCGTIDAPVAPDLNPVSTYDARAMAAALAGLKDSERLTNAAPSPASETPLDAGTVEPSTCDVEAGVPRKTTPYLQKYKVSATYDTQVLLNPSTDVIYPGSVLVGTSIDDGSYREVVKGTKNEITVSYGGLNAVTAKNGVGKISGTFYPSLSGFRQLHNDILGQTFQGANSTYTLNVYEVSTESSFDVHFGADVTYKAPAISASVKANFDYRTSSKLHKYMIRFAQTYYTVDVDQGRGTFLYRDFDIGDFKGYRPVYVSSVAYGRLAFITLESSESLKNIEMAMNVLFSGEMVSVDAGASVAMETIEKSSNLNITVIGSNTVVMTLDKFRSWLEDSGFSPSNTGQIVAYKLRYVDDNSVANTIFNGEYTLRSTRESPGHVDVTAQLTRIQYSDTDSGGGAAELYGSLTALYDKGSCPLFQRGEGSPLSINAGGAWTDVAGDKCQFRLASAAEIVLLSASGIAEDDDDFLGTEDETYPESTPVQASLADYAIAVPVDAGVDGGVGLPTYAHDFTVTAKESPGSNFVNFNVHMVGTPVCD